MSTNDIQQASTPDAQFCGELRTMSGQADTAQRDHLCSMHRAMDGYCFVCGSVKTDTDNLEGAPPTREERAEMARELDAVAPTPADKFRLMFGQHPTPRTDAAWAKRWDLHDVCPWGLARRLERELADALGTISMAINSANARQTETEHAIRERDNAESDRRQAQADTLRALHERNEAREQRDRLAVAFGELIAAVRINSLRDTFKEASPEQIATWLEPWIEKLAAVEATR